VSARSREFILGVVGTGIVVAAWELAGWTGLVDPRIFPGPVTAIRDAARTLAAQDVLVNLGWSLLRVVMGLVIGAVAGTVMAQVESVRRLVASPGASLGRFRRDSTLLRTVADLRDELSITSALLSNQSGSLARFGQDSIIAVQTAELSKQMTALFADIRRRPFRYIAF